MPITTQDAASASVTFDAYRQEGNRAVYIGPNHTDLLKQQMILTSASPKQTKDSFGNRRSALNAIRTVSVQNPNGDSTSKDMKLETLASIPVGATLAEFKDLVANTIGLLSDDTVVEKFYLTGKIDY